MSQCTLDATSKGSLQQWPLAKVASWIKPFWSDVFSPQKSLNFGGSDVGDCDDLKRDACGRRGGKGEKRWPRPLRMGRHSARHVTLSQALSSLPNEEWA